MPPDQTDDSTPTESETDDQTSSSSSPGITQEDLAKITAREKDQGRRAGRDSVLSELGFDNVKDAKAALETFRAQQDAAKTEAERARDKADADRQAAAAELAAARADRIEAGTLRSLAAANADPKQTGNLAVLVNSRLDGDPDQEAIDRVVSELSEEMPQLFASSSTSTQTSGVAGTGGTKRNQTDSNGKTVSKLEAGRERARASSTTPTP